MKIDGEVEPIILRKHYKLGTSDYEFISISDTYRVLVKDKDGNIVRRINENGVLVAVIKSVEPVTTKFVTELFNSPNMELRDTEGRSLAVYERLDKGDDIFFRGFVSFDEQSDSAYKFKLTMNQHAEDVLVSAKEGISFVKDSPKASSRRPKIEY